MTARTAGALMTRRVVTVRADASLFELAELMSRKGISGLPVTGLSGELVGVVSHSDLVRGTLPGRGLSEFFRVPGDETLVASDGSSGLRGRVGDIMSRDLVTVAEEASLTQVAAMMVSRKVHRVLVVREGRLLGLVSSLDLMRALADFVPKAAPEAKPLQRRLADRLDLDDDGKWDELLLEFPHLSARVASVREEHRRMRARLEELCDRAEGREGKERAEALGQALRGLSGELKTLKHREIELIADAYYQDSAPGD